MGHDKIRVGCGAGFAEDGSPLGVEIAEHVEHDDVTMECVAGPTTDGARA